MGKSELDWKQQGRNVLDWLTIMFAVVLITVYLALWWLASHPNYFLIALIIFSWLIVYFTDFWQPILYLIMAIFIVILLILWVIDGLWDRPLAQAAIVLNVGFLLLVVYLYYYEEKVASPA